MGGILSLSWERNNTRSVVIVALAPESGTKLVRRPCRHRFGPNVKRTVIIAEEAGGREVGRQPVREVAGFAPTVVATCACKLLLRVDQDSLSAAFRTS